MSEPIKPTTENHPPMTWTGPIDTGWSPTVNTLYAQINGSTTRRLARPEDLEALGYFRLPDPTPEPPRHKRAPKPRQRKLDKETT